MVEFSGDENKVVVQGSRYRAEEGEVGKCKGCVMKKGFTCFLTEVALRGVPMHLYHTISPRCQSKDRKDGRSVIWVLDI